ncbi:MAG TPA: hypothetical protein VIM62_05830 [Acidobacteriaceae bacterium]
MFSLTNHVTEFKSVTVRKEFHGDRKVLAVTIACRSICANSVLDEFDRNIRPLLYRKPDQNEMPPQDEMAFEITDGLTARRLQHFKPLAMDQKFPGYKMSLPSGIAVDDTIDAEQVELSKPVFEALEGGSVAIDYNLSFQVGWSNAGKLAHNIGEKVDLTLTPPTAEELAERQADLEDAA